jgi:pilus assembly protein Flp/PilA
MLKFLKTFARDERGVTLVEYGIAIALAVAVGVTSLTVLAGEIDGATIAAGASMPG